MNETPSASEQSSVQGPMGLTELLDEIERRNKRTVVFGECNIKDESVHADIFVDEERAVNDALVKALREAVDSFEAIAEPENKEPWSRDVAIEALSDIAQLLREPCGSSDPSRAEEESSDEAPIAEKTLDATGQMERIGHRLRTQDNRCTSNPMFCVQEKVTIYGMDPRWSDDIVWIEIDDGVREIKPPRNKRETDTIQKSAKKSYWKTVMAAFTEEGCKEYLALNGHNHSGETRIYVESWSRCPEMIAVREMLMKVPSDPKAPKSDYAPGASSPDSSVEPPEHSTHVRQMERYLKIADLILAGSEHGAIRWHGPDTRNQWCWQYRTAKDIAKILSTQDGSSPATSVESPDTKQGDSEDKGSAS